jgi:hypothetical protein
MDETVTGCFNPAGKMTGKRRFHPLRTALCALFLTDCGDRTLSPELDVSWKSKICAVNISKYEQ